MVSTLLTLLLALACGAAGTMFEVTWFRVLTPVLGNSAYSFAAVLAAFMAGFSLGGFLIGRLADKVKNPWRVLAGVALLTAFSAWWISAWRWCGHRRTFCWSGRRRATQRLSTMRSRPAESWSDTSRSLAWMTSCGLL